MRFLSMPFLFMFISILFISTSYASDTEKTVLFDQGHNQKFTIEEKGELHLSKLSDIFREASLNVISTNKTLTDNLLNGVSALVISGPFESLKPDEVKSVLHFIENGGRLAVMLHIPQPVSALLEAIQVDYSNVVLHERKNVIDSDGNFKVTTLSESALFSDLTQFSTFGCWALNPGKNIMALATTSEDAWVDLNGDKLLSKGDITGAFNVVVEGRIGNGGFIVFGDDAIFQNKYLDKNNSRLALNLAYFLNSKF